MTPMPTPTCALSCAQRSAKRAAMVDGSNGRYAKAVAPLLATAFTTLLTTTFKLLHCVPVGSDSVVYRAAGVTCDQWWRAPLFLVAGTLLLLPVAMALAARVSLAVARWCEAWPWQRKVWAKAVATKLRAPFTDGCWNWAAVLALQRLAVVKMKRHPYRTQSLASCFVLRRARI